MKENAELRHTAEYLVLPRMIFCTGTTVFLSGWLNFQVQLEYAESAYTEANKQISTQSLLSWSANAIYFPHINHQRLSLSKSLNPLLFQKPNPTITQCIAEV